MIKNNLGRENVFPLTFCSLSFRKIRTGTQGRTWEEEADAEAMKK